MSSFGKNAISASAASHVVTSNENRPVSPTAVLSDFARRRTETPPATSMRPGGGCANAAVMPHVNMRPW